MKTNVKLTAVREVHRFDEDTLGKYLQNKNDPYLVIRQSPFANQ